jgi:hypothetical protein
MNNIEHRYIVQEVSENQILTYFFVSHGKNEKEDVFKVIQYAFVQEFNDKPVFNLGLGDLDMETGGINDVSMTGNGDVYRIFNTVLSTIPQFYEKYPNDVILVQGSDGREAFEAACRPTCTRKCSEGCHNYNRRMKTYCTYVSRKYSIFEPEYQFLGVYEMWTIGLTLRILHKAKYMMRLCCIGKMFSFIV